MKDASQRPQLSARGDTTPLAPVTGGIIGATRIHEFVKTNGINAGIPDGSDTVALHGKMTMKNKISTELIIIVTSIWPAIPPQVFCNEKWLRKERDWHIYSSGKLCYVLDLAWKDFIETTIATNGVEYATQYAASWCYNSVEWLMTRHWIGHREGLVTWPAEWPAWKHGYDGVKQNKELKANERKTRHNK